MDFAYEMRNAEVSSSFPLHFSDSTVIPASQAELFTYLDNHAQLSAHMTRRSWMMGGGRMAISTDEGGFQRLGSRLRLAGRVFGLMLVLEEEITEYRPPQVKTWRTIGTPRLLIIGGYCMGFEITPAPGGSRLRVFLDYELPTGVFTHLLGVLLAPIYARWCVRNMIAEGKKRFSQA
jgi:Polyketide cyclase / dehydrase and lipid transport